MAIIQDWKIRSTHARCELSGEPFSDGQEFHTCLFEDPATDGFIRRDYSVPAWREVRRKLNPAPFSFWKSIYKAPAKEAENQADSEASIEGMLRRFIDEDDSRTENARYILALMLERNKTLIHTDSKDADTRTLLFYEHADNGDVFIVADPGLRLDEIESVQREVSDLLAEEERRAAERSSAEAEKEPDQHPEADEDQTENQGEKPADTEDETVSRAGEEFPEAFGADPGIRSGSEFADEVDEEFEATEAGEEPTSGNDEPHAHGRID